MYDLKIACRGIPARYKLQFLTEPSQVLRTWRADPYFCWVSDTGATVRVTARLVVRPERGLQLWTRLKPRFLKHQGGQ